MSKLYSIAFCLMSRRTLQCSDIRTVFVSRLPFRYDRNLSCSTIRKDSNLSSLVAKVLKRTSQIDVMVSTIPQTLLSKHVEILLSLEAHPDEIVDLFVKKPVLVQSKTLVPLVNILKSYGIENEKVVMLIGKNNNFHDTNPEKIATCFECLRKIGLSNEEILNLFLKNQDIIHVSVKELNTRFNELKKLFSSEHSLRLMKTMPLIITESITDIKEKFMYVHYSMGMSQHHMISASLFRHSLKHVKKRHTFLERAGLFQKPRKKDSKTSTNTLLKDIINTTDAKFVQIYSKTMTAEDYSTFCKLVEKEIDFTVPEQINMDSDMQ
ncbi:hypothetical protein LOTGIDRAFT_228626 [Lottia gigantea]|uniref:Uncharacterized protein n=1 Tax=Lottia gigantea TaxID=225164 RepID=V3ZR50_LOTGI|nr:hypothetical protein LOTGIDRAFT_228626 [Lottia gigantea]ESO93878.1 hypothetical protein LOTGIDRAFT_228626 [Lottia gigantea]